MPADPIAELDPPPRPWRVTARLLVLNPAGRLLLIRACDPGAPGSAEWWEAPGGGVEAGEDTVAAAVRETAEETGVVVPRTLVGPPCWLGEATYVWMGMRYWASLVIHLARLDGPAEIRHHAWQPDEQLAFLAVHWVPVDDLTSGNPRTFPSRLPMDLPRILAGETVHAPFDVWN